MKKRLLSLTLVSLLTLSVFLTGCSTSPSNKPADNSGNTTQQSTSGGEKKDNITLRLDADISTLDQCFSATTTNGNVMAQLYDTLYYVSPDHTLHPRLAESYEVSDDNLTYTFKLRKGVKFHNGEEFKASDAVFTINRSITSPYLLTYVEQIKSAEAVDDYTFKITLKNVYAPFIEIVSSIYMVNEKAVIEAGDKFGESPIGTGPYKFVSYQNASILKLVRFDDYFRGPARIKDVTYNVISDINTATIALETGETDLGSFSSSSYETIKANENLVLEETASAHLMYVMMNLEKAPFDNKLVRQAVSYALDREFIADVSADGLATYSSAFLNPQVFGYSDNVKKYEYDLEKAKLLMQEAGLADGITIDPIKTIDGSFKKVAEVVQSNLADIGITTTIEILEQNKYVEDAITGNFGIGVMGTELGIDAENFSIFFTPENIGGNNMARYNNPKVNELFLKGKTTLEPAERLKIYEECFGIIEEDAVYASLYNKKAILAHNKNLKLDHMYPMYNFIYDMSWQ